METTQKLFAKLITQTLPALILSLVLFIGGIWLLISRIPGWSLFLGIPATQIGIILLIFTFDEINKKKNLPDNYHLTPCSVCRKPTPAPIDQPEKICLECRTKIKLKLKQKN